MNKDAILNQFGFFKGISNQSREMLADICLSKTYQKKEVLFTEGQHGQAVYLCVNGRIQLHKTTLDGKDVVIKVIKPGEVFGEVILFEMDRYPVTAMALSRAQIFIMPKHQFHCLLEAGRFSDRFHPGSSCASSAFWPIKSNI